MHRVHLKGPPGDWTVQFEFIGKVKRAFTWIIQGHIPTLEEEVTDTAAGLHG